MQRIKLQNLQKTNLVNLLGRCAELHIGVIGDLALDVYWYADMTQAYLSRETPHFPRPVFREKYTCGAGANVADNVKSLGVGLVTVFSVLGDDWRGALLQQAMGKKGIDCSQVIVSRHRSTSAYIKPILVGYESQQEDARIDFVNNSSLNESLESDIINAVKSSLPSLDALIITDQLEVNGMITGRILQELNDLASSYPDTIFAVDSRLRIGAYNRMFLKPNKQEAILAVSYDSDPGTTSVEDLVKVAELLSHRTHSSVFLTLGEEGMLIYGKDRVWHCPSAPVYPPLDTVGAGDTSIAAISASLAAGANICEAAVIANLAAAVTVEKLNQTGTASSTEILERYDLAIEENI